MQEEGRGEEERTVEYMGRRLERWVGKGLARGGAGRVNALWVRKWVWEGVGCEKREGGRRRIRRRGRLLRAEVGEGGGGGRRGKEMRRGLG